jgi:O-antigen/teichoic acid export membrane protein
LLPLVYGRNFTAAVPSAMVMVAFAGLAFGTAGTAALQGLERASFVAALGALGAAASVVAGLVVIPAAGIWGAAWSRVAIHTAMTAAGAVYLARRHGFSFPTWDLTRMLSAAAACAMCSGAIVWGWGGITSVVVAIPASAVVYVVMVRLLRVVKPEDLLVLHELTDRLPASLRPSVLASLGQLTGNPFRPQSPVL